MCDRVEVVYDYSICSFFSCLSQANEWCSQGVDLLAAQQLEKYASVDFAQRALVDLDKFLEARAQLRIISDEKCAGDAQQGTDDSFGAKKPSVVQMASFIRSPLAFCRH